MLTQFRALQETEPVLPKERGQINGRIKITINGDEHSLYRYTGKYSAFVSIDGKSEYACSPDTEALFDRYCVGENSNSDISVSKGTPEDRLVGLSVECAEPKTQDDYLAVARKIVAQWLDSLKTETGRYKLESYRFTDSLADNRVFHGDGYVNGGREFVCYVGFDTPTEDESTAFYASGTYDTFYHYYFGPGEFAESVRLQVTENGILKPVTGENGSIVYEEEHLFNDKSNTAHYDVTEGASTDYRMYSQRFYLPENSRKYTPDDGKVICYFWNNTDKNVEAGGEYEIQRLNGGSWETVSNGKQIPYTQVKAGGCAELCFDISDLTDGEYSVYRIKTNAGRGVVYGGFYMGSTEAASLEITSAEYPTGTKQISFEVKNEGFSTVYPDTIELYRGDEKLCDIDTAVCKRIDGGAAVTVNVSEKEISGDFLAGDYRLKITAGGSEFVGKASVKEVPPEMLYYFPTFVTAEKTDGGINLLLKTISGTSKMSC